LGFAAGRQSSHKKLLIMKSVAVLFLSLVVGASATELTLDTWDDAVAGKTVFIKFLSPG
jgi:hypothetical protein